MRPSSAETHRWALVEGQTLDKDSGTHVPTLDWRCGTCGAYRRGSTAWRLDGTTSLPCDEEVVRQVLDS